jgi:hypothetical protein
MSRDYTYYTDEFLNACLSHVSDIKLTADTFVSVKDEELEENPLPLKKEDEFPVDFGLKLRSEHRAPF